MSCIVPKKSRSRPLARVVFMDPLVADGFDFGRELGKELAGDGVFVRRRGESDEGDTAGVGGGEGLHF